MIDGLWTVPPWGRPAAAPTAWTTLRVAHTAHSPDGGEASRCRGGLIFDDQMGPFSIVNVLVKRPRWAHFR